MTRLEQLKAQQAKQAEKLAASKKQVAIEEAKERDKVRKAHNRRCYKVGAMVADAGLFCLEDTTLGALLALLGPLAELPDPVRHPGWAYWRTAGAGLQGGACPTG
jgi:hypothetical protein